jgi:hypothetical protein
MADVRAEIVEMVMGADASALPALVACVRLLALVRPALHDPQPQRGEWVTVPEIAEEFRLNLSHLYKRVRDGRVPAGSVQRTGKSVRLKRSTFLGTAPPPLPFVKPEKRPAGRTPTRSLADVMMPRAA